jgi:type I restriction enzyme S subunit
MSRIDECKIKIACNITTGKLDANQAVKGGQYPFFTCAEHPEEIDHFAFDGDVVLVAGNNAKGNFHVSRYKGKFNAYQRTYILRANEQFDIDYIYYTLKLELKRLQERSQGSQTKFLTMPILTGISIRCIGLEWQQKISAILAMLDAKIDLNNRINTELETLAKTVYDYWFVQFDFPDAQGRPYKTSGGKMEWNEKLKREIPEGWGEGKLADIANITMGSSPSGESYNETGEGVVFFQGSTDFGLRSPQVRQYTTAPVRIAKTDDILLSVRAPVGTMNIADRDCCIGRGLAALNSRDGFDGYLYYVMSYFKQVFDRRNTEGTTFGSINKEDLHGLQVALPPKSVLSAYDAQAKNWNRLSAINDQQNCELSTLRDWLLPLLMNGQAHVK